MGACQPPEILGDRTAALACIERFAAQAYGVNLLLFPECFLQGYLVEEHHVRTQALALTSPAFTAIRERLSHIGPTLVFGLIELHEGRYFNSAVVLTKGELGGVYRKTHLTAGESLFTPGDAYPTFGQYGINICSDTRHPEAAAAIAAQGATILLVPSQNMMKRQAAERLKDLHHQVRAERARETGMWVISADVTGARDPHRIAYGPTSVMNPDGDVVAQVPTGREGMVIAEVGRCGRRPG
ncbi:carbon-nitrogen hydrolase family protein [Nonomuraea sp. NPDC050556]|uniref:carbon-nitrogen hydrolase family protein n=1 Tax=Nonomuraea sp. NPDC050556 TaxID=3364369 RepID=UPI00378D35F8